MRILLLFCLTTSLNAQDWAVFNPGFRYNYRFDNAASITNVIFADSAEVVNGDTICYLNRVVKECPCPGNTITPGVGEVLFDINSEQFLQRKLIKHANGSVTLSDPAQINFPGSIQPNDTWMFNSAKSHSATCLSKGLGNIFGISDSIKTILVNLTDTIKLSKSFGVIVFPNDNSGYYRLSGIEQKSSYDSIALFGEKVPNAWDFNNFQVGDILCYSGSSRHPLNSNNRFPKQCVYKQYSVTSKTIVPSGYLYTVDTYSAYASLDTQLGSFELPDCSAGSYKTELWACTGLSGNNIPENYMYPGMFMKKTFLPIPFQMNFNYGVAFGHIARLDQTNNYVYKFLSNATSSPANELMHKAGSIYSRSFIRSAISFATGYGMLQVMNNLGEASGEISLTCFYRGGFNFFGPGEKVGLETMKLVEPAVYPNPASSFIKIQAYGNSTFSAFNMYGDLVSAGEFSDDLTVDCRLWPNGIYIIKLKCDGLEHSFKLIVAH